MCIRDSLYSYVAAMPLARTDSLGRYWDEVDEMIEDLEGHRLAALGSVSYTHLRAHETVLDLVCRLLLEKKNQ